MWFLFLDLDLELIIYLLLFIERRAAILFISWTWQRCWSIDGLST